MFKSPVFNNEASWYAMRFNPGNPSIRHRGGNYYVEIVMVPKWILDTLRARGHHPVKVFESAEQAQYLSVEEQAQVLCMPRVLGEKGSPFQDMWLDSAAYSEGIPRDAFLEFAYTLAASPEIRDTVVNKLQREPLQYATEKKRYEFVKGERALWVAVDECFMYEMKDDAKRREFFEEAFRWFVSHYKVSELAAGSPLFAATIAHL